MFFRPHQKRKPAVFKFLEIFEKLSFCDGLMWTVTNRRKKAEFCNFLDVL